MKKKDRCKGGDSMHTGDDLTNVTARMFAETAIEAVKLSKEIAEGAVKVTARTVSQGTYLILKALLAKMVEYNKNLHPGRTNLGKLLKSEKELKMIDMKAEDLKHFAEKAKKFGICYAVIKDGDKNHVVFKTEDSERIEKVFKSTINAKLEGQKLEYAKSKKKSIADKIRRKLNPKEKVPEKIWNEIEKTDRKANVELNKKVNISSANSKLRKDDTYVLNSSNNYSKVLDKETKTNVNNVLKFVKRNQNTKPSIRSKLNRLSRDRNITKRTRGKRISRGRGR